MLLRRLHHYPNVLRHRPLCTCAGDPTEAKLISTLFLFYPHRLSSLRHVITPSIALRSIRRLENPRAALGLLNILSSEFDVPHSPAAYCHVISLLVQSKLLGDALKVFDEMTDGEQAVDPFFVDFVLSSCVKAGDLDSCLQLIDKAIELKCQIWLYTFSSLLNLLLNRNRAQDAIFLFRTLSRSQLFAPDTYSFNIIINACCRVGDINGAFEFFKEMKEFGCLPDTITHNVLIDGLCKANQVDRGWEILSGIKFDVSCLPNVKTYTSVISGYCKLGKLEEAKRIFDDMVGFGIRPSRFTYNVLIDGFGKICNMKSSMSLYERMRICGCPPDVVTFTSLIHGYCRSGQLDDAVKLLREMGASQVRPNAYTFSVVIDSLCRKNRLEEARELLRELNGRRDVSPHAFIYNPVIDGFCKAGDVEKANLILVEMEHRGCRPDKHTYTILIIGHCMKGRMTEAIGLFDKMMATGCAPDGITTNSIVSLLFKAAMPGEAKRIMAIVARKDTGSDVSPSK